MSQTPRFRPGRRDELTDDQAALYDEIAGGPRRREAGVVPFADDEGRLLGPFGLMTIAPGTGQAVQALGAAIRFQGVLSPSRREVAILAVAAHHTSDFEWFAHREAARRAGVTDEDADAILRGVEPGGEYAILWRTVRAVLDGGRLADDEYADAVAEIGAEGVAEIVWLSGYYSMLATALRVFDPPVPDGARGVFTQRG